MRGSQTLTLALTVPMLFLTVAGAIAQAPPKKVFVPDGKGDVSDAVGAVIASEICGALVAHQIEALTYTNLKSQLGEEQKKELLGCTESGCMDELITNFGIADRIFCQVTRLGKDEYHVELSHFVKEKLRPGGKVLETLACREQDLPAVAARLALELLGLSTGGSVTAKVLERRIGEQAETYEPVAAVGVVVQFESNPPGAALTVDGQTLCQATPCSKILAPGRHNVQMIREKHLARTETVNLSQSNRGVVWTLEPDFGWLTVESTPSGLPVSVDGTVVGTTPLMQMETARGPHRVLITDPRYYDQGRDVTVDCGEKERVTVSLVAREGAIEVYAADSDENDLEADVWVDGYSLGKTPLTARVIIGEHQVLVRALGVTWQDTVDVAERQTAHVHAVLRRSPVATERWSAWSEGPSSIETKHKTSPTTAWGWVTAGTAGVLAATGGALWLWGEVDMDDVSSGQSGSMNQTTARELEDRANLKQTTALVCWTGAGIAALGALVLFAVPEDDDKRFGRALPRLDFVPGGGMLTVGGSF